MAEKRRKHERVGAVAVGEPRLGGECGRVCWTARTNARSSKDAKWYISKKKRGAGRRRLITTSPANMSGSLETELCLDPAVHKKGRYLVAVRVYGQMDKWLWSRFQIDFDPKPQNTLRLVLDDDPKFNVGR